MLIKNVLQQFKSKSNIQRFSVSYSKCTKASYIHHIGKHPLLYKTIGQIYDIANEKFPERQAIVSCHEKRTVTFREILSQADHLAAGLLHLGLQKGDRIAILSPNNIQWLITFVATARLGLISVLLNPAYQPNELKYCLKKVGVSAIVTADTFKSQNYYEMLSSIMPELQQSQPGKINSANVPSLKTIIIMTDTNMPGVFKFDDITGFATPETIQKIRDIQWNLSPDLPLNIQFTSGTTGKPKAALLSHFNFINNSNQFGIRNELDKKYHRVCVQVPFFHAFGTVATIVPSILFGTTLVLPSPSFNATKSLEAINAEKCTILHGTPTMYVDLINKIKELNYDVSTPELALTGGAPCSPQLFKNMLKYLKIKEVKSIFGLTETTAVLFHSLPNDNEYYSTKTVGHLTDHIEAKVVDLNGNILPFGTPGELQVRGYCNMLGYWKDDEKTKEMIGLDGWLKTGDQFVLEENGYGRIVGRFKDMIIRGGENIFPKEIEDFLNTHPDVIECHVFGISDERMGEEVCACIKIHKDSDVTFEKLKTFCKGKISHFKIPKYIKFVEDFPTTATGKIQKFKLKDMVEKELINTTG